MYTLCDVDFHVKLSFIVVHFLSESAIEFYIDQENELPKKVGYAIRLEGYWSTELTYPPFMPDGPMM